MILGLSHKIKYFLFLFCWPVFYFAAGTPGSQGGNRIKLHLGPAIGFYKINPNHADDPKQHFSVLIGFTKEIKLGRSAQTFFLVGADYFYHGLSFNSYYFPPGTVKIYDNNFNYSYKLDINELNLPLQFKYLFKREDNSVYSPYLGIAYHLRYFLPGTLQVTQDGNPIKEDQLDLKFKTPLFNEKINSAVSVSAGWQKNMLTHSKGSFYAELNFRYCFSPYYFETDYSASSLYINSMHLTLQLGIKF